MCILEFNKVLMHKFHYDYIKNKYDIKSKLLLQILIVECMKLKLKTSMKILAAIKKCLILVIIRLTENTIMVQENLSLEK